MPKMKESVLSDPEFLRDLNSLDYKLWEEAIELSRLDVISIQRMKPYYAEAAAAANRTKTNDATEEFCCGVTCRKISRGAVEE